MNLQNLTLKSALNNVIDVLQEYLNTLDHNHAKPSEAQLSRVKADMISSAPAPGAHLTLTDTPIFIPINQPDLPADSARHVCDNNMNTHSNSLRERNESLLTMITSKVEWREAMNRNLIGFSKNKVGNSKGSNRFILTCAQG